MACNFSLYFFVLMRYKMNVLIVFLYIATNICYIFITGYLRMNTQGIYTRHKDKHDVDYNIPRIPFWMNRKPHAMTACLLCSYIQIISVCWYANWCNVMFGNTLWAWWLRSWQIIDYSSLLLRTSVEFTRRSGCNSISTL